MHFSFSLCLCEDYNVNWSSLVYIHLILYSMEKSQVVTVNAKRSKDIINPCNLSLLFIIAILPFYGRNNLFCYKNLIILLFVEKNPIHKPTVNFMLKKNRSLHLPRHVFLHIIIQSVMTLYYVNSA